MLWHSSKRMRQEDGDLVRWLSSKEFSVKVNLIVPNVDVRDFQVFA